MANYKLHYLLSFVIYITIIFSNSIYSIDKIELNTEENKNNPPLFLISNFISSSIQNRVFFEPKQIINALSNISFSNSLKILILDLEVPDTFNFQKYFKSNINQFQFFTTLISDKRKAISSKYFSYQTINFAELFSNFFTKSHADLKIKKSNLRLGTIKYQDEHNHILEEDSSSIINIAIPYEKINKLDETLQTSINHFIDKNYIILISFTVFITHKEEQTIFNQNNIRLIEESSTPSSDVLYYEVEVQNLPLEGYTVSAYMFGLFVLFIIITGVSVLFNVKTHDKFAKLPLIVGRES